MLNLLLHTGCNVCPAHCKHLVHGAVTYYLAHRSLRDVTQCHHRLPYPEQKTVRILNTVLHHPFNIGKVKIAGKHERLVNGSLLGVFRPDAGGRGAETELLFLLPLDGNLIEPFD